jgi:stress-induced morphogen
MPRVAKKVQDETTTRIFAALKKAFPELPDDPEKVVYRYNPVAIRVRIVSPKFKGKSTAEREEMVNKAFKSLPDELTEDITMQFMLTPDEAKKPTLLDREFDDPTGSYL